MTCGWLSCVVVSLFFFSTISGTSSLQSASSFILMTCGWLLCVVVSLFFFSAIGGTSSLQSISSFILMTCGLCSLILFSFSVLNVIRGTSASEFSFLNDFCTQLVDPPSILMIFLSEQTISLSISWIRFFSFSVQASIVDKDILTGIFPTILLPFSLMELFSVVVWIFSGTHSHNWL